MEGFSPQPKPIEVAQSYKDLFKAHINPSWKDLLNIQKDDSSKFHIAIYSGKVNGCPDLSKMKTRNVIYWFAKKHPTRNYVEGLIQAHVDLYRSYCNSIKGWFV